MIYSDQIICFQDKFIFNSYKEVSKVTISMHNLPHQCNLITPPLDYPQIIHIKNKL